MVSGRITSLAPSGSFVTPPPPLQPGDTHAGAAFSEHFKMESGSFVTPQHFQQRDMPERLVCKHLKKTKVFSSPFSDVFLICGVPEFDYNMFVFC